jgi:hypothetical protein
MYILPKASLPFSTEECFIPFQTLDYLSFRPIQLDYSITKAAKRGLLQLLHWQQEREEE